MKIDLTLFSLSIRLYLLHLVRLALIGAFIYGITRLLFNISFLDSLNDGELIFIGFGGGSVLMVVLMLVIKRSPFDFAEGMETRWKEKIKKLETKSSVKETGAHDLMVIVVMMAICGGIPIWALWEYLEYWGIPVGIAIWAWLHYRHFYMNPYKRRNWFRKHTGK